VTDLAGYRIYYGPSASEMTKTIDIAGASSTNYVVNGLAVGHYYFSVVAFNSAGLDSGNSSEASTILWVNASVCALCSPGCYGDVPRNARLLSTFYESSAPSQCTNSCGA